MSSNPWETEPSYINIGGLNTILDTNRKFCCDDTKSGEINSHQHDSVVFLYALRDLTSINKEQVKISLDLKKRQLYQEFYNVLNTEVLDGLISMVDFLSNHFQQIIDNKNEIIKHLHQPFVGKTISIDARYHSDICQLFPLVAKSLAEISTTLNNLEWIHKYSIHNSNLSSCLQTINSSLISLQHQHETVSQLRDLMNEMLKQSEI